MIKKVFCLFLTFIMIFAFSAMSFATNTNDKKIVEPQSIYVGSGSGKSTEGIAISGKFTLKSKYKMKLTVSTNFPTIVLFKFKDSNDKSLGTASLTITKSGHYSITPTSAILSADTYSYELTFMDSDVSYTYHVEALT